MKFAKMLLVAVPLAALGACTMSLDDQDRALITSANSNAQQAKDMAQQALNMAQANVDAAAKSANQAASDARAASEKADRMFQRPLRKTSP